MALVGPRFPARGPRNDTARSGPFRRYPGTALAAGDVRHSDGRAAATDGLTVAKGLGLLKRFETAMYISYVRQTNHDSFRRSLDIQMDPPFAVDDVEYSKLTEYQTNFVHR